MLFNFTSQNKIPYNSKLIIILPTNLILADELEMRINGETASGLYLDKETYTVQATIT